MRVHVHGYIEFMQDPGKCWCPFEKVEWSYTVIVLRPYGLKLLPIVLCTLLHS